MPKIEDYALLGDVHTAALISSTDLLYQAHVHTVMAGMGFQPGLA